MNPFPILSTCLPVYGGRETLMQKKHTPGPWFATQGVCGQPSVLTYRDDEHPETWNPRESGAYIAMSIGDHTEQRTSGNEWANAALIAAAPDLLVALEDLVDYVDEMHRIGHIQRPVQFSLARAAIAKATQPLNPA